MDAWVCMRCRTTNTEGARSCVRCGSASEPDHPVTIQEAFPGVGVVRDVHHDSVSAALTGRASASGAPELQPFFQLEQAPRWPRLRRVARLWPLLVFVVVLLFFAVAGLTR